MIPTELTSRAHWVLWIKKETAPGKFTKIPVQRSGAAASTTDPNTWADYASLEKFRNLGFVFVSGIVAIDLDNVLVDGELPSWADSIIKDCNSYTEISPSGEGLHVLGYGEKPRWMPSRVDMPSGSGLEIYDTERYFTITKNVFRDFTEFRQIEVATVFDFLKPAPAPARRKNSGSADHFNVSIHDVVSRYREEENCPHPYHDSSTGANFRIDRGGETFRCWRHGITQGALYLLGVREGIISCGDDPTREEWVKIFEAARKEKVIPESQSTDAQASKSKLERDVQAWLEKHGY